MTQNQTIGAALFDLDGTLLDTAPDLFHACNQVLDDYQRPRVSLAEFRDWVHGGTALMICQSFQISPQHADYSNITASFLNYYQQQIAQHTQLFNGIDQVLNFLDLQKIPWGVVTNKPHYLTQPLLDHFGLTARTSCIVSGDTLPFAKPHPAPLFYACDIIQVAPARCVYVGDTLGDIHAAQAAGMVSVAVSYGYKPSGTQIEQWKADNLADSPMELLSLFSKLITKTFS